MEDKKDTPQKVCLWYKTPQGCRNGTKCKFLHDDDRKDLPLCKFYPSTYGCFRGNSCAFRHEGSGPTRNNPPAPAVTDLKRETKKPQPGTKSKALPIGDEEPPKVVEKEPTPQQKPSRRVDSQPVRPPRKDSDQGQVSRPTPVVEPKQQEKPRQQEPIKSPPVKEEKSKPVVKKEEEEEQDEEEQDEEEEEQEETTSPPPTTVTVTAAAAPAAKQPVSRGAPKSEESGSRPAVKQEAEKKEKEKEKESEGSKEKGWSGWGNAGAQPGGKPATTSAVQSVGVGQVAWKKGEPEQPKPQPTKPSAAAPAKGKEDAGASKKPATKQPQQSEKAVEKKVAPKSTAASSTSSATTATSPKPSTATSPKPSSATSPKTGPSNPPTNIPKKSAWIKPLRPPTLEGSGGATKR